MKKVAQELFIATQFYKHEIEFFNVFFVADNNKGRGHDGREHH